MPRKKPLPTVSTAKTRLQELQAMRRVLAKAIDDEGTPARDLPPLVRRLQELAHDIDAAEAQERDAVAAKKHGEAGDEPFKLSAI